MSQSSPKARVAPRPAVTVAGLSVLAVIILSALHEVSAPDVVARETTALSKPGDAAGTQTTAKSDAADAASLTTVSTSQDKSATAETTDAEDKAGATDATGAKDKPLRTAEAQSSVQPKADDKSAQTFSDIVLGDPDAPVTVIEYASMTCSHCASFHATTLPKLKAKYIDTGKVKYIMRAFPLDNLAAAAFMLARCVDQDQYYDFVDLLFEKQSQWAKSDEPVKELRQISKVAGFTEARFKQCLRDQDALDYIQKVRNTGDQQYDIRATPTLIINGQKLEGAQPIEKLEAVIDPLLEDTKKS